MAGLDALTPNTAAFLDSISMGDDPNFKNATGNQGFPPSTFFPMPGRHTPEESSPSSTSDAKKNNNFKSMVSDDSDQELLSASHKRKAYTPVDSGMNIDDDDDDDSVEEDPSHAHNDKRVHAPEPSRKSGRKSIDKKTGEKIKDTMTKAQRRKEQNRAAQKAFRERREAKVRDLEQKVAELEAKSFGASVENENLRGILRRLQEENMALKQSHFTFSMPMNGASAAGTPQMQPPATSGLPASSIDWATYNQVTKPPSPPQSANDTLRSIHDPSPRVHRASTSSHSDQMHAQLRHRSSVGSVHRSSVASDNSPEPLNSINGPSPSASSERSIPSLFGGLNSAAPPPNHMNGPSPPGALSSPSSTGGNKEDVEALFRSLYPNGLDVVLANATNATSYTAAGYTAPGLTAPVARPTVPPKVQSPYTFIGSQTGLASIADSTSNALARMFDSTSYRDSKATGPTSPLSSTALLPGPSSAVFNSTALASQAAWSGVTNNSVNEFLSSLNGSSSTDGVADASSAAVDDDIFSRQIEALMATQHGAMSPSTAFNLPDATTSAFSPTTYLNMSPSPLPSLSNSTPQSTAPTSNGTSPQTDSSAGGVHNHPGAQPDTCSSKIIHVLGEDGRVMRPSEVWTKMGMHNTTDPGDLLIDDLCDQMKSKATCKDGRRYMSYDDVETIVRTQEQIHGTTRFGTRKPPPTCEGKAYHDPAECQARLNAAYIQANGGNL